MFNDSIIAALRDCKRASLDLTELGLGVHSLESLEQRRSAISVLLPPVKILDPTRRTAMAERICQLAEVVPPDDLMMTSSQVAALARDGFGIGGHTVSHPILARLDPTMREKKFITAASALRRSLTTRSLVCLP